MPHCPRCLEEQSGAWARCPWDRSFYVLTTCPACRAEAFPRERVGGACGRPLAERLSGQAPLTRAGFWRRLLTMGMDVLAIFIFAPLTLELWDSPLAPVGFTLTYFTLLQAGGRQTLGQLVLRCVALDEHWRSLSLPAALRRTLMLGWGRSSAIWSSPDL